MAKRKTNDDGGANIRHMELVNAVKVMVLTPHIAKYLQEHDPKALQQAIDALGMTMRDIDAIVRPPDTDVTVTQEGSVFHFALHNEQVTEFVPTQFQLEPWQWLGKSAFAIDHRYAPSVVCVFRDNGFNVVVR